MPVEETSALNITCDNPACPGNSLDPADRTGWLFVTSEVYGQQTQQHVYCSADCASADAVTSFAPPEAGVTPAQLPDDLDQLTRAELNELADERGVENAAGLPNKEAVIDAIEATAP